MPRSFRHLIAAGLMAVAIVLPVAAGQTVWVALTEGDGIYAEAAQALAAGLDKELEMRVAPWQGLPYGDARPDLLVPVGVKALDGILEKIDRLGAGWDRVPVLAILIPRDVFEARRGLAKMGMRQYSAVILEQPLERQLALIRRAFPDYRHIGILPGPAVSARIPALKKAAQAFGLTPVIGPEIAESTDISRTLRSVLGQAELILALPDPRVYYSTSLPYILLTAYRSRVPVLAYSPAFVQAGAVLGIFSTPAQIGEEAADRVRSWRATAELPAAAPARRFSLQVNRKVAESLGLSLDDPEAMVRDLMAAERRVAPKQ